MAKAKLGRVHHTGAKAGDILFGEDDLNRNMQIRIHSRQIANEKEKGKRIGGKFDLLKAGDGDYSQYLEEFEGQTFEANDLITRIQAAQALDGSLDAIRNPKAKKCMHILNRQELKVLQQT